MGASGWQRVAHLDLLPAAHVLIHWLAGLRDGLPHIGDDLCHLRNTKPAHLDINLCDTSTEWKIGFILSLLGGFKDNLIHASISIVMFFLSVTCNLQSVCVCCRQE